MQMWVRSAAAIALMSLLLASACNDSVQLVNDSERAIVALYLAEPGTSSWGKELLGGGRIGEMGGSYEFDFFDCTRYDVRLLLKLPDAPAEEPGAECVIQNLALCEGPWRVTNDNLVACGIPLRPPDGGSTDATAD